MQKKTIVILLISVIIALLLGCARENAVRTSVAAIIKALETNDTHTLSELAPFLSTVTTVQSLQLNKNLKRLLSENYSVRFESEDKAVLVFRGDPALMLSMIRTREKKWVLQDSILFNQTIEIIEKSSE